MKGLTRTMRENLKALAKAGCEHDFARSTCGYESPYDPLERRGLVEKVRRDVTVVLHRQPHYRLTPLGRAELHRNAQDD